MMILDVFLQQKEKAEKCFKTILIEVVENGGFVLEDLKFENLSERIVSFKISKGNNVALFRTMNDGPNLKIASSLENKNIYKNREYYYNTLLELKTALEDCIKRTFWREE